MELLGNAGSNTQGARVGKLTTERIGCSGPVKRGGGVTRGPGGEMGAERMAPRWADGEKLRTGLARLRPACRLRRAA